MKTTALIFSFLVLQAGWCFAQPAAWSRLGTGARGMGSANAAASSTFDGRYSLYNPALVAGSEHFNAELTSAAMPFGMQWNLVQMSAPLPPTAGFAFGIMHAGVRDIDARSVSGYPDGTLETNEFMIFSSFGIRFSPDMSGGVNVKVFRSSLHQSVDPASAFALDAGLLFRISERMALSFSAHDLLGSFKWKTGAFYGDETAPERIENLPLTLKTGLTWEHNGSSISGELMRIAFEGETIETAVSDFPGFSVLFTENAAKSATTIARLGIRRQIHERLIIRGGVQQLISHPNRPDISAGASFLLPYDRFKPAIDYALVRPAYQPGFMHIFSFRWKWN